MREAGGRRRVLWGAGLRLAARRSGDTVILTLRDSGPGVSETQRARIFDPFFSTRGVGKGLGPGLPISYNIVHDFGGALDVRDHPGGGAEFRLVLRAARVPTRTGKETVQ